MYNSEQSLEQDIDSYVADTIGFLKHFFVTVFLLFLSIPLWQASVKAMVFLYLTEEQKKSVTSGEILNSLNPFLVSDGEVKLDIVFLYFFFLLFFISWFFSGRKRRYAWLSGVIVSSGCVLWLLYY